MVESKLQIEDVDPSSEEQILVLERLAKEIWEHHYIPIVGAAQIEYMLDKFQSAKPMKEQMKNGYSYYLAKNSNSIGYLCIKSQGNYLFISKIYIHHSQRGNGYGKKLISFAEKKAKSNRLSALRLIVNKQNSNTISFYESLGFENRRELVTDIGRGYVMDDFEMVKNLS